MAAIRSMVASSLVSVLISVSFSQNLEIVPVTSTLEAYGCPDGWHSLHEHCYKVVVEEVTSDSAKSQCENLDGKLASVWTQQEKEFISNLWQFPRYHVGLLWIGLRGWNDDSWKYDDKSTLQTPGDNGRWSVLDEVSDEPSVTTDKCVSLRPSGAVAFLDCSTTGDAYVCKRALSKVYVTTRVDNHTIDAIPTPSQPLNSEQLFERLFPPRLVALPQDDNRLAVIDVDTEVDCAYNCFSTKNCQVFQVSCQTYTKCSKFRCSMFPDSIGIL